jgi:predicted RNA-binding protein
MPSYWALSGTLENWKVALEKGVWGVRALSLFSIWAQS